MGYGDFKDLTRRTISDKILPDEAFSFSKNLKYVRYQCGLSLMVYKLFDKKSGSDITSSDSDIKNENISSKELAEELNIPNIRKF